MQINSLDIYGFGKLNERKVDLTGGINLLVGNNESGKSSIHEFISAMFYGFIKDGLKRSKYIKLMDDYKPWYAQKYGGTLNFMYGGCDYSVEQVFSEHNRKTTLYNITKGEDVSRCLDNYGTKELKQVGSYLFGLSLSEFEAVYSIRQLEAQISTSSAKTLNDRYISTVTGQMGSVSVLKAMNYLDERSSEIGTERAFTKPLGALAVERKELIKSLNSFTDHLSEEKNVLSKLKLIEGELKSLRGRMKDLNGIEMALGYKEASSRLEARKQLYNSIKAYETRIEKIKSDGIVTPEEFNDIVAKKKFIDDMIGQIDQVSADIADMENKMLISEDEISDKILRINEDIAKLNLFKAEKQKQEYESVPSKTLLASSVLAMSMCIVSVILSGYGVRYSIYAVIISALAVGAIAVMWGMYIKKSRERSLKRHLNDQIINAVMKDICSENDLNELEFDDRENLLEILYKKRSDLDDFLNRRNSLILSMRSLEEKIEICRRDMKECIILTGAGSYEEVKHRYDNFLELQKFVSRREETAQNLLSSQSGESDESIISLFAKYAEFAGVETEGYDINGVEDEKKSLAEKEKALVMQRQDQRGILSRITAVKHDIRDLEERLSEVDDVINGYKTELEDISIAKKLFKSVGEDYYNNKGVDINNLVGERVYRLSGGNYVRAYVSLENANVLLEESTGKVVGLEQVSVGTRDQVYIALRLALMNLLEKESLPFILDDAFNHFDDERLENMMKILLEESEKRQIIILSCQSREKVIFDKLGVDYNLIEV